MENLEVHDNSPTYMVFENNDKWAISTRPKFVIKGTRAEVDALLADLEISRSRMGENNGNHLTAYPIPSFDSVEHYYTVANKIKEDLREQAFHDNAMIRTFKNML